MKVDAYNPETDIPSLSGKVILVTGGTAGLGAESLRQLAKHKPAHLYFTGRNQKSADSLIGELREIDASVAVTFLKCDLGSRATIAKAVQQSFHSDRLDVFIASAGLMAVPADVTADGYEIQFGTSHMGNFTLLKLLLPVMLRTAEQPGADVRLVALTSLGYMLHPSGGFLFDSIKTSQANKNTWVKYGQSKLANILMVKEMARRYPQITSAVVHPGTVNTGLVSTLGLVDWLIVQVTNIGSWFTLGQGARNMLWAATTKRDNLQNGGYYLPVGEFQIPRKDGANMELAEKLWNWSEHELRDMKLSQA